MTAAKAPPRRTTIAVAVMLAARALPHLTGALDRVSIAMIDGTTVTYAHLGADSDTVYEIGSVSKTFTSMLLADAIRLNEALHWWSA